MTTPNPAPTPPEPPAGGGTPGAGASDRPAPVFDPSATHQQRPRLRPVRGFPVQMGSNTMLGLADARQISDRMVVTVPAAQVILPLMDGARDLDQIVREVGRGLSRPVLEQIVAQLDDAGLIEGPRFDAMLSKARADFDSSAVLPPATSAAIADALVERAAGEGGATEQQKAEQGPQRLREALDAWIAAALKDAPDPSLDTLPRAIVVPHIDYPRGWINYAGAYGRLRVADRPDRVVILGTNHFGLATGVCGCDKGYSTPLGVCEADTAVVEGLRARLGDALYQHRFDHEHEHSIELQIPWIQHVFGPGPDGQFPRVVGALVHDPCPRNGESYDGTGVALEPFVEALRAVLASLPGRTLVVSSADLSHAGPAFGDEQPLSGESGPGAEARNRIFRHDREMLAILERNAPAELVSAMAWQQNPTRWCSIGNLVATFMTVQPESVRLLNYAAAMDEGGTTFVSSASMILS